VFRWTLLRLKRTVCGIDRSIRHRLGEVLGGVCKPGGTWLCLVPGGYSIRSPANGACRGSRPWLPCIAS